jgi:hypothetical protein
MRPLSAGLWVGKYPALYFQGNPAAICADKKPVNPPFADRVELIFRDREGQPVFPANGIHYLPFRHLGGPDIGNGFAAHIVKGKAPRRQFTGLGAWV